MISPHAAVTAAATTYSGIAPTWTGTGFQQTIRAYASRADGLKVVAIEGSATWQNWFDDVLAGAVPIANHPAVGRVHRGFRDAGDSLSAAIDDVGEPYVIAAHSLGAALALYMPVELPRRPLAIFAFAPPRVYADQIPDWILALVAAGGAWRFGNDPVPDLPGWFPQVPLEPIGRAMPLPTDCHHIDNYLTALTPQEKAA
jgi:alpha-beta hydrolase superfamily lysophospholipase